MRSIKTRLITSLLLGVGVASIGSGWLVYRRVRSSLTEQFDTGLASKARAIATLLEFENSNIEFDYAGGLMPEFQGGDRPEYFEMRLDDGRLVYKSITLGDDDLPRQFGGMVRPHHWDLDLPDGRHGRAVGLLFPLSSDDNVDDGVVDAQPGSDVDTRSDDWSDGTVQSGVAPADDAMLLPNVGLVVARSREELDQSLAAVSNALLLAGVLLAGVVTTMIALSVKRGLSPVARLGEEVSQIRASTLSVRVGEEGLPSELDTIAAQINGLLARLEQAFDRERRMTANLAHELRTPIAELRSASDVANRWPDDEVLRQAVLETASSVSIRMTDLTSGLLRLARAANGSAELENAPLNLREFQDELWQPFQHAAADRELRFDNSIPMQARMTSDRALLAIAFNNLMDNAVRFATPGSAIVSRAELDSDDEVVAVSIENRTEAMGAADLPRLIEPFWQGDRARSDTRHAGLGLSLVASVAEVLEFDLRFEFEETFRVSLVRRPS